MYQGALCAPQTLPQADSHRGIRNAQTASLERRQTDRSEKLVPYRRVEGAVFKLFAGSDHYIHQEQPELFARVVSDFLDDPRAPETHLRTTVRPSGSEQRCFADYGTP